MRYLLIALAFLLAASSCRNTRNLTYLKNIESSDLPLVYKKQDRLYTIRSHDILFVRVLSSNKEIADLYNNLPSRGISATMSAEADQYVNGFTVNRQGEINLPVLGRVSVKGFNIEQVHDVIQAKADEFLIDATVIVRLLNYKITVLGEVRRPGVYFNYNNQMTIMDLLGRAGDITEFGDRKHIVIVRPSEEGATTMEVDLTNRNALAMEGYYLMPNDVVFVKPAKNKAFRTNLPFWNLTLSFLTTSIVLLQYFED